jgi:hypothetical protein
MLLQQIWFNAINIEFDQKYPFFHLLFISFYWNACSVSVYFITFVSLLLFNYSPISNAIYIININITTTTPKVNIKEYLSIVC